MVGIYRVLFCVTQARKTLVADTSAASEKPLALNDRACYALWFRLSKSSATRRRKNLAKPHCPRRSRRGAVSGKITRTPRHHTLERRRSDDATAKRDSVNSRYVCTHTTDRVVTVDPAIFCDFLRDTEPRARFLVANTAQNIYLIQSNKVL